MGMDGRKLTKNIKLKGIKGEKYLSLRRRFEMYSPHELIVVTTVINIRDGRPAPRKTGCPSPPRKIDEICGAQRGKTECRFH